MSKKLATPALSSGLVAHQPILVKKETSSQNLRAVYIICDASQQKSRDEDTKHMNAELLTVKQRFELPELQTLSGATIKNVAVGFETYGKLDASRENAILVAHFFSGSSHAAG